MEQTFAVLFTTKDLVGRNISLEAGDPFPDQSKMAVRRLGSGYGERDYESKSWAKLSYVRTLTVREGLARRIVSQCIPFDEAKKLK